MHREDAHDVVGGAVGPKQRRGPSPSCELPVQGSDWETSRAGRAGRAGPGGCTRSAGGRQLWLSLST